LTRRFNQILKPEKKSDSLPCILNRKRVYILPTAHGYLFLIILFGMLLGSINYNNNLGFLLVFLLGSITLVSMIHTYRNILGAEILSVYAKPVFAGDIARFTFRVRPGNTQRKAVCMMIEKDHPAIENISAKTDQPVTVTAFTKGRGVFTINRVVLWSRYPLGLFRTWSVINARISCLVYPKPAAGPLRFDAGPGDDGSEERPVQQGVDDFSGLKQYQPGDPINRISWKSLSRGLGVFTKDFSGDGGASVMLSYDTISAADREYKLSRLCDMVLKAHNMNAEYGLSLPGRNIPPGKGERHKHLCLKSLALFYNAP